jgi:ABC-type transport system substrate-binding protein
MRSRTAMLILSAMFLISTVYMARVYGDEVDNPYNFSIVVEYNTGGSRDIIASYMLQNLAPIGIRCELDGGPWYRVVSDYLAGTMPYDMMILGITGGGPNPDQAYMVHTNPAYGYLAQILIGNNGTESYLHAGVPLDVIERMDNLTAVWPTVFDAQEKTAMVIEWQKLYTDYVLGYYPIYYPRTFTAIPAAFEGYNPDEGVLGSIQRGAHWTAGGNAGGQGDDEFTFDIGTTAGWNPYTTADSSSSTVYGYIFDRLVNIDGDLNLQPRIATDWTVSDDWTHWEFHVPDPDNATDVASGDITYWCDPADPDDISHEVTCEDVLFTIDVCLSPVGDNGNHQGGWAYAGLSDYGMVSGRDDLIYFDLATPDSDLPLTFSFEVIPQYFLDNGEPEEDWGYPLDNPAWALFSHTGPASGPYYVDDYALGPGGHVYMTESPIYEARSADLNGSTMLSPMDLVIPNCYT